MVMPEEVKEPVDQEAFDLAEERMPCFGGLARGGRQGDHDVAQDRGLDVGKHPFPQREREHVRGPVFAAVSPV
jgi:hypothetical protein